MKMVSMKTASRIASESPLMGPPSWPRLASNRAGQPLLITRVSSRARGSMHTQPLAMRGGRARVVRAEARFGGGAIRGSGGYPDVPDRIMGAIPYILPFLNAFVYARFLYTTVPVARMFLKPLMPVISGYNSIPFGSLIAFFALYLGMINNNKLSRFVRFNATQALLLDILLILPRLMESVISPPMGGWGADVYIHSQSFIWIFITAWVIYGIFSCLIGQYGRIPFIAEAADQQMR